MDKKEWRKHARACEHHVEGHSGALWCNVSSPYDVCDEEECPMVLRKVEVGEVDGVGMQRGPLLPEAVPCPYCGQRVVLFVGAGVEEDDLVFVDHLISGMIEIIEKVREINEKKKLELEVVKEAIRMVEDNLKPRQRRIRERIRKWEGR